MKLVRRLSVVLAIALVGMVSQNARAQGDDPSNRQLLDDTLHYVYIHSYDLAQSYAQALLDRGLTPAEFVDLVDSKDPELFKSTVHRMMRIPEVEEVGTQLSALYTSGRLEIARHPEEISRNIELLTKDRRARNFARKGLLHAGEYAMPQLLKAYADRGNPALQAEVRQVLVELQAQAIMPIITILPTADPATQELLVGVLGDIQYTASVPFIYELHAETNSAAVRAACQRAVLRITDVFNDSVGLSDRFASLANWYYAESQSLTSFKDEEYQLVWNAEPQLFMTPVKTEVYHEAMALHLCERSLAHDSTNRYALALWIAANFSREIDTPEGYDNPTYAADRRDATYYAVAAGPSVCQPVLGRALKDRDTQLARRAIAAIERTAGGNSLWVFEGGRSPLLDALQYPNRRVHYEAALAIGAAQPRNPFEGADRVVPILASAIRDASQLYAVVVTNEAERQTQLTDVLQAQGYTVLPPGRSLSEIAQPIADAPGVDLLVVDLPGSAVADLIAESRSRRKLRATPILAVVPREAASDLQSVFFGDPTVSIIRGGASDRRLATSLDELVEAAEGGPITPDEARDYKRRALAVLRDLAVAGASVLNVGDAATPLVAALPDSSRGIKFEIAEVLSYIDAERVQVALMDEALDADGEDQARLLELTSNSAKRWGNKLSGRQVGRLIRLAMSDSDQATAAAALMGSLELPNDRLIPLITGEQGSRLTETTTGTLDVAARE